MRSAVNYRWTYYWNHCPRYFKQARYIDIAENKYILNHENSRNEFKQFLNETFVTASVRPRIKRFNKWPPLNSSQMGFLYSASALIKIGLCFYAFYFFPEVSRFATNNVNSSDGQKMNGSWDVPRKCLYQTKPSNGLFFCRGRRNRVKVHFTVITVESRFGHENNTGPTHEVFRKQWKSV